MNRRTAIALLSVPLAGQQYVACGHTTIVTEFAIDLAPLPSLLSFLNGSTLVSLIFGHLYRWLPGNVGAIKGMVYGVLAWAIMGLVFIPMIGLGLFALQVGLGISPALFSLAMLLTYSVTLGMVYGAINS